MTTHLKASQKLDLLGIGAAHQKDPHGIAWKQNRDFETLLMRLNSRKEEGGGVDGGDCDVAKIEGFVSATGKEKDEVEVDHGEADLPKTKTKKKKRVAVCENDENEESKKKKKRKRDLVQEGSEDKKPGKEEMISDDPSVGAKKSCHQPTSPFEPGTQASLKPFGRRMAHRARIQASKRLATKSAAAISEILGIAPSLAATSSSSLSSSPAPCDMHLPTEKLMTSSKSIADYFRDKLATKSSSLATPSQEQSGEQLTEPEVHRPGLGCGVRLSLGGPGGLGERSHNGSRLLESMDIGTRRSRNQELGVPSMAREDGDAGQCISEKEMHGEKELALGADASISKKKKRRKETKDMQTDKVEAVIAAEVSNQEKQRQRKEDKDKKQNL